MKTIRIISTRQADRAAAKAMLEGRGWSVAETPTTPTDAYYIMRGWRDGCEAEDNANAARATGRQIYWEPNPPPNLLCPDFATASKVAWHDITKEFDERKGRRRYQFGAPISEAWQLVELARKCGHKVTVQLSPHSSTTIVATIYANGKRTYFLKMWASNETQARNALEELSAVELESIA